jgi:hypothetical protein
VLIKKYSESGQKALNKLFLDYWTWSVRNFRRSGFIFLFEGVAGFHDLVVFTSGFILKG